MAPDSAIFPFWIINIFEVQQYIYRASLVQALQRKDPEEAEASSW